MPDAWVDLETWQQALHPYLTPKHRKPITACRDGLAVRIPLLDRTQEARALQIGRVVRLAARYTPWNSNCFPQALTARALLGLVF